MLFKMLSAIWFNLDQSKMLSSGNEFKRQSLLTKKLAKKLSYCFIYTGSILQRIKLSRLICSRAEKLCMGREKAAVRGGYLDVLHLTKLKIYI